MRILQISDPHMVPGEGECIYGVDPWRSLERVLAQAMDNAPELVLVTGDLAEGGDGPSYRRLGGLLRTLGLPVLVLPGNHDLPEPLAAELCDDRVTCPRTHDLGAWRLVLLDSRVPGASHGEVSTEERSRLEALLDTAADRFVLVALHHTPISPCPSLGCRLVGAGGLLEQLAGHGNVKAVVAGHAHTAAEAGFRGIRLLTTPSTCAEVRHAQAGACLDLEDFRATHSFDPARHGYRLLDLADDGSLATQVHWVENPEVGTRAESG